MHYSYVKHHICSNSINRGAELAGTGISREFPNEHQLLHVWRPDMNDGTHRYNSRRPATVLPVDA